MQYTASCRAKVIAEVTGCLYWNMVHGNPNQKLEAEYDLADSEWFRELCKAVKVVEYDNVINSLHKIIDNLKIMEKNYEYSFESRKMFTNRKELIEDIVTIIKKCTRTN